MNDRARPALQLGLFFSANILFAAGLFAHAFLYNFYLDALALSESVMGGAAASMTAGGLAALVPAGRLVDRRGPGSVYLIAAAVAGAGLVLGAVVAHPLAVYAAGFVAGAGTAAWRVVMGPAIMRMTDGPARARAFSWNVALLVASGAGWTAASAVLPSWYRDVFDGSELAGLRSALILGAVMTMAAGILLPRALRRAARSDDAAAPTMSALEGIDSRTDRCARSRRDAGPAAGARARAFYGPAWLVSLVALVALWMLASALVLPFFNLYFQRVHGLAIARIGAIFAAAQLVTAGVVALSAELSARAGPSRVLIGWAVLLAPALLFLDRTGATGPAILLFMLAGFVAPATNPLIDQVLLERAPSDRQGAVSTWRNAATELSGLSGAGAGGLVLEATSFRILFTLAATVAAAGALSLTIRLRRDGSRPGPAPA